MDDPLRGQVESGREPSFTGRAAANLAGGFQEAGAGGVVDCTINPTAAKQ